MQAEPAATKLKPPLVSLLSLTLTLIEAAYHLLITKTLEPRLYLRLDGSRSHILYGS